jgi:hypothetical protein
LRLLRPWLVFFTLGACRFATEGVGGEGGEPVDGDVIDPADAALRFDADPAAPDADPAAPDAGPVDAPPAPEPDADPGAALVLAESDKDLVALRRDPGGAAWATLGSLKSAEPPRWAAGARSRRGGFLAVATLGGGMARAIELHQGGDPPLVVTGITPELDRVRAFDLAVEHDSGDALFVYSDGSTRPRYQTFTGNGWSAAAPLPINDGSGPTLNTAKVEWMQLVPAPRGDAIALLYSDAAGQLQAIFWAGNAWRTSGGGTSIVSKNLKRNAVDFAVQNRAFDGAYEAESGDLVVAFGQEGQFGFGWTQWDASSDFWSTPVIDARAPAAGESHFVDLAAQPGSDRVAAALCDLGDNVERLGAATWNGTSWIAALELDSQTRNWEDKAQGRFPCAVAWQGDTAVLAYADENAKLSWGRWQPGDDWQLQPDVALMGVGACESILLVASGDELVGVVLDDKKKLFSLAYDGSAWERLEPTTLTDKLLVDALPVVLLPGER